MPRAIRSAFVVVLAAVLLGAGLVLVISVVIVLLTGESARSQTQGVIVWESGTDYRKPEQKGLTSQPEQAEQNVAAGIRGAGDMLSESRPGSAQLPVRKRKDFSSPLLAPGH